MKASSESSSPLLPATLDNNSQKLCDLLGIRYPIIQAGMVWVSGADLVIAAMKAGCLGILGGGSLKGELLRQHIRKVHGADVTGSFAVNFPIMYHGIKEQVEIALQEGVKIFFMSAGSPRLFTSYLQDRGARVFHVTSSPKLARKCEDAGVDGIVAEGFEAGGHNGRDELTTMVLIPQVKEVVSCPVIAAGGIASGAQMLAALALGADGVQIGSRFAATRESHAHPHFKQAICAAQPEDTRLMLKALAPVRLLRNPFFDKVAQAEQQGASVEELRDLLSQGRARAGMHEGDLEEGELEIGQVSGMIKDTPSCQELVGRLIEEYRQARDSLTDL